MNNTMPTRAIPWAGCVLHKVHLPKPVRTHIHHRFPKFLQIRKHGKLVNLTTAKVCPTGHDDVHAAIDALLAKKPIPKGVGRSELELAREALRHFETDY